MPANMVEERHDGMADYMQRVGAQLVELSVEGRNMLSVADKNAVGSRRAGWRVIARVEQNENVKGNEQPATYATEHVVKVGTELQGVCDGIFRADGHELHRFGQHGRVEGVVLQDEGRLLPILAGGIAEAGADESAGAEDCGGSTGAVH